MTIEEFDKTGFSGITKLEYQEKEYDVITVDFEQKLLAFDLYGDMEDLKWVRCENVKIINQ